MTDVHAKSVGSEIAPCISTATVWICLFDGCSALRICAWFIAHGPGWILLGIMEQHCTAS